MLNTVNPDYLISISSMGTFNLRRNAKSLNSSCPCRITMQDVEKRLI